MTHGQRPPQLRVVVLSQSRRPPQSLPNRFIRHPKLLPRKTRWRNTARKPRGLQQARPMHPCQNLPVDRQHHARPFRSCPSFRRYLRAARRPRGRRLRIKPRKIPGRQRRRPRRLRLRLRILVPPTSRSRRRRPRQSRPHVDLFLAGVPSLRDPAPLLPSPSLVRTDPLTARLTVCHLHMAARRPTGTRLGLRATQAPSLRRSEPIGSVLHRRLSSLSPGA